MKSTINLNDGTLVLEPVYDGLQRVTVPAVKLIPAKLPIPINLNMSRSEAVLIGNAFLVMAHECTP